MAQKQSDKSFLGKIIGEEGIKSDVNITLTDDTAWKIAFTLLGAGIGIVVVAKVLKYFIKNRQLNQISNQLTAIHETLQK